MCESEGDRFEIGANLRVNPRVNNLKVGAVAEGELRSPRVTADGRAIDHSGKVCEYQNDKIPLCSTGPTESVKTENVIPK